MACRKFNPQWAPTPLLSPDELRQRPRPAGFSPPTGWRRDLAVLAFALRFGLREAFRWFLTLLGRKKERTAADAKDLREFAERMGGMWITLASLASLGGELWGRSFCQELRLTRDRACPIPCGMVQQIIEDELRSLGTSFADEFSEFDETPMVSKSFSQVHRACLRKTGHQVTIRVRAPDAEQRAASDWRSLRILAFLLAPIGFDPRSLIDDLLFEVKLATDDLLDFRTEVTELKKIRRILGRRRIYVPLIFSRLSTERLLIVEYIQGVSLSDIRQLSQTDAGRCDRWFRENNIKRSRIWQRLFNMHHELLFQYSLFYTELFSKNILLLKNGHIALVSFGTIGTIDAELQRKYMQFCRALLDRDFTRAAETYLTMGPALPYTDLLGMKLSVGRALRHWESRNFVKRHPYREKALAAAVGIVAHCASEHGLPKLWNLARLQKAEDILGDSLTFIDTTKSGIAALRRYEYVAQNRTIKKAYSKSKTRKQFYSMADMAQLNKQLIENFEHDGKYLRQRLIGFQGRMGRAAQVLGRLLRITSNLIMLILLSELFLFIKHTYIAPTAGIEHGPLGHLFAILRVQSKVTWISLIIGLFFLGRFLRSLARQLFAKEIRPADVI